MRIKGSDWMHMLWFSFSFTSRNADGGYFWAPLRRQCALYDILEIRRVARAGKSSDFSSAPTPFWICTPPRWSAYARSLRSDAANPLISITSQRWHDFRAFANATHAYHFVKTISGIPSLLPSYAPYHAFITAAIILFFSPSLARFLSNQPMSLESPFVVTEAYPPPPQPAHHHALAAPSDTAPPAPAVSRNPAGALS